MGQKPSAEVLQSLYWNENLSLRDIGKLFHVRGESTVRKWMERYNIKRRDRIYACKVASSEKNTIKPILTPSEDLAYILGVLVGDGCVCHTTSGDYFAALNVKTKVFAESFAKSLKKIGLNPFIQHIWVTSIINGRQYEGYDWRVRAYSKLLFQWFKNLKVTEFQKFLKKPEYKIAFLRGLYESEGSRGYWSCGKGKKAWTMRIVMLNFSVLKLSKELFLDLGYKLCLTHSHHTSSGKLLYSLEKTAKEVPEILETLNPCIKGYDGDACTS